MQLRDKKAKFEWKTLFCFRRSFSTFFHCIWHSKREEKNLNHDTSLAKLGHLFKRLLSNTYDLCWLRFSLFFCRCFKSRSSIRRFLLLPRRFCTQVALEAFLSSAQWFVVWSLTSRIFLYFCFLPSSFSCIFIFLSSPQIECCDS